MHFFSNGCTLDSMTIALAKDFFSKINNLSSILIAVNDPRVTVNDPNKKFNLSEKFHAIKQATARLPISFDNLEEIALIRVRLNRVNHFIKYFESIDIDNLEFRRHHNTGFHEIARFKAQLETLLQGLPNITEEQILLAEERINNASKELAELADPLLNIVSILRNIELPESPKIDRRNFNDINEYCRAKNALNASIYEEQRDGMLAHILESSGKPDDEYNFNVFPLDRIQDAEDIACMEIRLRRVENFIERLKPGETYRLDPNKNNQQISEVTPEALMTLVDALRNKLPESSEKTIERVGEWMHFDEHGIDCVIS